MPQGRTLPNWVLVAILAVVYFIAAQLGLTLARVHPSATAVWPPAGIALAALLFFGYRVWPGIFLGAFLANITTAGSAATSLGIATGNTLEGVLGAYLVNRFCGGLNTFDRAENVFKFTLLAAMLSTTVSATFGVTSLSLGRYAGWSDYGAIWFAWWLGDAGGDLIVAPLLILWSVNPRIRWDRNRLSEAGLLLLSLMVISQIVFGGWSPIRNPLPFLYISALLWAAFRFGQRETATLTFLTGAVGIWGTLRGVGPFVRESQNESFLLLAFFMCVVAVTAMAVAAAVSERRQTEERLKHQAAQLAERGQLLEHAPVLIRNMKDEIVFWNAGMEKLYGWPKGEVLGKVSHVLMETKFPAAPDQIKADLLQNEEWQGELTHSSRDGSAIIVSSYWRLHRDASGVPVAILEVHNDVTDLKRVAKALNSRLEQQALVAALGLRALRGTDLSTLLNEAVRVIGSSLEVEHSSVLELRPDGRTLLLLAGTGWKEGYVGREAVSAGTDSLPGYTLLSEEPVIVDDIRAETRFKASPFLLDHNVVSGMTVIVYGKDQAYGVLGAYTTRRRNFSRDDTHFLQAVANVLAPAIEGQRTEEQLRLYAAEIESFSYTAAHNLRSPLVAITHLSEVLLKDHANRMVPHVQRYVRRIIEYAEHMDELIKGLLAYGRFSRVDLKPERWSLMTLLPEVLNRLGEEIQRSGAHIDLQEHLPEVLADRVTLVEILLNLLSNAIKFVKPGVSPRIRVWAEEKGEFVRLWVEDDGIGITREHQERIFRIFERPHGSNTYPGNGIGLAIVAKGATWMGGRTGVESEVGKGSRFWIELPKPKQRVKDEPRAGE